MLKLLNLFNFLCLHLPLLLLHVRELIDQFRVCLLGEGLSSARSGARSCIRSVALVQIIPCRAASGKSTFEADLDPGPFILAVTQLDTLNFRVIVAELGHVEVAFAEDATSFVAGDRELRLIKSRARYGSMNAGKTLLTIFGLVGFPSSSHCMFVLMSND